jgi:hypothetical protein
MYASVIRTVVPLIVGILVTNALKLGVQLPEGSVTEIVTVLVSGAYYWVFRYAEQFKPLLGRIFLALGATAKQPVYVQPGSVQPIGERRL